MLKIRMQRIGRRHDPHFRVIVTDSRRGPKSGNFIELLGSYNAKLGQVDLKEERIKYWLSVGAKVSGTVHNFLVDKKIIDAKKVNVLPKKSAPVKEKEEEKSPEKKEVEEKPEAEGEGEKEESSEEKVEDVVKEEEETPVEEEETKEDKKEEPEAPEEKEEVSKEEPKEEHKEEESTDGPEEEKKD